MLSEPTWATLRSLRLDAAAAAWTKQRKIHERLGLLLDAECLPGKQATRRLLVYGRAPFLRVPRHCKTCRRNTSIVSSMVTSSSPVKVP
jgi:hypothetical protein